MEATAAPLGGAHHAPLIAPFLRFPLRAVAVFSHCIWLVHLSVIATSSHLPKTSPDCALSLWFLRLVREDQLSVTLDPLFLSPARTLPFDRISVRCIVSESIPHSIYGEHKVTKVINLTAGFYWFARSVSAH